MNFKTLFCGLAAAAMFTACSSDEPSNGGGNGNNGQLVDAGYITVGINLPTTKGSRAANDQFDHGTANEYAVKNAMLLVFTGAEADGEGAAKFHSAYDLTMTPGGVGPDVPNNITTTYLKTVHLNNVSDDDYLWGLVLVNYDNIVTEKALAQPSQEGLKEHEQFVGLVRSMKLNGTALAAETTFDAIRGKITSNSFINDGYFFMTNAVVSTADANGATASTVYTLQKIGKATDVAKPTPAEAQAYPAASFYVERAVAKATLNAATVRTFGDLADNHIEIEKVEWVLDNQEPSSYIVRNVGNNSYISYQSTALGMQKRFVGTVKIGTTALQPIADLYRHYWAIDPTYADGRTAVKNYTTDADFKASGVDNPQYCHENTFPINFMDYKNTTRAVLKVTFKLPAGNDGALYTVNNLQSDGNIFSTQVAATTLPVKAIVVSDQVRDAAKAVLIPSVTHTIVAEDLNITFAEPDANGVIKVSDVTFKDNDAVFTSTPVIADEAKATLINNVNASFQVVKYVGGVAYYDIRFKHFGDEYTPFQKGYADGSIQSTTEAYGTEDNNYLGRWGMVRNNWYEINLNTIKKLGMPVLGQMDITNDDTPDDSQEIEKWLSFKINILSWAKRVQNEDL
ncbi:MAG: fimbria major subunit [Muribaculaceae bacterium]